MSRIGKHPVIVPKGVTVSLDGQKLSVKGKLGALESTLGNLIVASYEGDKITVKPANDSREARMQWGSGRTQVANMVKGVDTGFTVDLEISGVGYRAAVQGQELVLQLGYSHDIKYPIPAGITMKTEKPTAIAISGYDRQLIGKVAAEIRSMRPPEPYKGKGIKYSTETILRKEGKKK